MISPRHLLALLQPLAARVRAALAAAQSSASPVTALLPRPIPYSERGSEPVSNPENLLGRESECAALVALLEERPVILLHGEVRIGKTYLARQVAAGWKQEGRPFLYTCATDQGMGDLFGHLAQFFWANGYETFSELMAQPETNDDDRLQALAAPLAQDRYLIVLDAFEQVDSRLLFQKLVHQFCNEDFKGRLLLCARERPVWFGALPPELAGEMALAGLGLEDIRAFARWHGLAEAALEGLEGPMHPFVLQLLILLAQQRQVPLLALLEGIPPDDREQVLLTQIYQGLEARELLDQLSVLRLPFLPKVFPIFGGKEDLISGPPLTLLVETQKDGRHTLHPLVQKLASQRLAEQPLLRQQAHEQATDYYQELLASGGRDQAASCVEGAHHLLELGRSREALEGLRQYVREVVSFGYGRKLLALTRRIEAAGLVDSVPDPGERIHVLLDLALLYVRLPVSDVADNHLRAIRYCGQAITCCPRTQDPVLHASALNTLGMACSGLPIGDPRKNLHRAQQSYREALAIFQQYNLPAGCAVVHNNIGAAWMELSALGGEWCIDRAVGHFKLAARLYQEGVDPFTRALVESNLGHALCLLGRVDQGMGHFQEALRHFRMDNLPREYADTQRHLGDAHRLLSSGSRIVQLQQAIRYYAAALKVYEEEVFPEDFARTQHFLGVAHQQLALYEDASKHRSLAVKCYQNALRVYTEEGFPYNHRVISATLERDLQKS